MRIVVGFLISDTRTTKCYILEYFDTIRKNDTVTYYDPGGVWKRYRWCDFCQR